MANPNALKEVNKYVGAAYIYLNVKAKELYDADLKGKTTIEGNTVIGDFTLTGVKKIRDAMLAK